MPLPWEVHSMAEAGTVPAMKKRPGCMQKMSQAESWTVTWWHAPLGKKAGIPAFCIALAFLTFLGSSSLQSSAYEKSQAQTVALVMKGTSRRSCTGPPVPDCLSLSTEESSNPSATLRSSKAISWYSQHFQPTAGLHEPALGSWPRYCPEFHDESLRVCST